MKPQPWCSHHFPFLFAFSHVVWLIFGIPPFPYASQVFKEYLCPSAWVSQMATRPVAFFCSLWSGCVGWTRNHAEVCESKFRSRYTCTLMRFVTCQPNFSAISHTKLPVLWRISFHESSTLIWDLEIRILGKAGTGLMFLNLGFMLESPSGIWLNSSGMWPEHLRLSYISLRWLHCAAKVECQ